MLSITPFRFDNNTICIDPEILTYPIFKKVWDCTVDSELRFKYFVYIYHSADFNCTPNKKGFNPNETHSYAVKMAKLTPLENIPDCVKQAITFYKETFISPIKQLSINLVGSINRNVKILDKIDIRIDRILSTIDITTEQIAELINLQKEIITIATQLPKQILSLKEINKLIENDIDDTKLARGKTEIESSMDGDDDIENLI